jgi:hypothetical protein
VEETLAGIVCIGWGISAPIDCGRGGKGTLKPEAFALSCLHPCSLLCERIPEDTQIRFGFGIMLY